MNPDTTKTQEFLLRRTAEGFSDFSPWAILIPIAFAFLVPLLLIVLRRENRFRGMPLTFAIIAVFAAVYAGLAVTFKPIFSWWVILVPMLGVALAYVIMMYVRDSRSIHPAWAAFLGLLRVSVYTILAVVFLLPGCQLYDTNERGFKSLALFDVSGSTLTVDALPKPGEPPMRRQDEIHATLIADGKLQKIVDKTPLVAYRFGRRLDGLFVKRIRQGEDIGNPKSWLVWLKPDKKKLEVPDWIKQKDPSINKNVLADLYDTLLSGTDLSGAALQMAKIEANSPLQSILIVSDGQNNLGSLEDLETFYTLVRGGKSPIPVITVGVGAYKEPASIRIEDLQAPEDVRPDDKFPIVVPVVGPGLKGENFTVKLELQQIEDANGNKVAKPRTVFVGPKSSAFEGEEGIPRATVNFKIDLQKLTGIKVENDQQEKKDGKKDKKDTKKQEVTQTSSPLEGVWQVRAMVPKHPGEVNFQDKEHISRPVKITVQKSKLRILLFAGGPTRDYQFLRTLFYREQKSNAVQLGVYLQTAKQNEDISQDVSSEWLLTRFPDQLTKETTKDHTSLNEYDVIVAVDPDWSELTKKQIDNLETWVGKYAGGIVFVGGPVHTYYLAREREENKQLFNLLPVALKDSRFMTEHDASRPYKLNFSAGKSYDFLKLDEQGDQATAGWNEFFWRGAVRWLGIGDVMSMPTRDGKDKVEVRLLDAAPNQVSVTVGTAASKGTLSGMKANESRKTTVGGRRFVVRVESIAATKKGNEARIRVTEMGSGRPYRGFYSYYPIKETRPGSEVIATFAGPAYTKINNGRDEQPFMVMLRYGQGKTFFLGSAESWRLRHYKTGYHERFWKKLARAVAGNASKQKRYGRILIPDRVKANRQFTFLAQIRGSDLKPLPRDQRPAVLVTTPDGDTRSLKSFSLEPSNRRGEWEGSFSAEYTPRTQGEYTFKIQIPGVDQALTRSLVVTQPQLEYDNVRNDFLTLYRKASEAEPVLNRMDPETRLKVETALKKSAGELPRSSEVDVSKLRLFFTNMNAGVIQKCFFELQPQRQSVKGPFNDLWDEGSSWFSTSAYYLLLILPAAICLIAAGILATLRQPVGALIALGIGAAISTSVVLVDLAVRPDWAMVPVDFSFVLVTIVGLLSIEWLTRKLLRLA